MGQERQFVDKPAVRGFLDLRNWFREPVDEMSDGKCGIISSFEDVGEQRSHMRKSIS